MKYDHIPQVRIRPMDGAGSRFLATFHSQFLNATYACAFSASVTGAVALHRFVSMIEHQYDRKVGIRIDGEPDTNTNTEIADMLDRLRHA